MSLTYSTPGVYVNEVSALPPSIAAVPTAIPAFIGYTQQALINNVQWDYSANGVATPIKITSFLDFTTLFGGASNPTVNRVNLDNNNNVTSVGVSYTYYLFDSIRLFFANGGGTCYIISVGTYDYENGPTLSGKGTNGLTGSNYTGLWGGLNAAALVDEVTMLVFPDAVSLSNSSDFYSLYQEALDQCATLKDRIVLMDVLSNDFGGLGNPNGPAYGFRNGIGMDNLSYGAAYIPWLNANLSGVITYNDIASSLYQNGNNVSLSALASSTNTTVQTLLTKLNNLTTETTNFSTDQDTIIGTSDNLTDCFKTLIGNLTATQNETNLVSAIDEFYKSANVVDARLNDPIVQGMTELKTPISSLITGSLNTILTTIVSYDLELKANLSSGFDYSEQATDATNGLKLTASNGWLNVSTVGASSVLTTGANASLTTDTQKVNAFIPLLAAQFNLLNTALSSFLALPTIVSAAMESGLESAFPLFNQIVTAINNYATPIPPSGIMAGIYASVDSSRGVWKAPANVSVQNVTGASNKFTSSDLDGLNIDVEAGKSVNVIRDITGQGTMVMGSRTLAGNDNNWRYVPVRRLYIFTETSVKLSTAWAVFEPNEAVTWVKIITMIENFLNNLWKQGALVGSTPDQAYYVNCGLGLTMTQDDIDNGYLKVIVGLAAVRPAEFIELTFTQVIQSS